MQNKDLVSILQKYDGEVEITTSNKKGVFSDIDGVEMQEWTDCYGNSHASITLVLGGYDDSRSIVDSDEEFIDNVNSNLEPEDWIDKEEAIEAKRVYEDEIERDEYEENFNLRYDNAAKESMIELFGDDSPLEKSSTQRLVKYVYENGWEDEIPESDLLDRNALITFLYVKVSNLIVEKMKEPDEPTGFTFADDAVERFIQGFGGEFEDFLKNLCK